MNRDYVSYWYEARVKQGDSDSIKVALFSPGIRGVDRIMSDYPHREVDGFGAIVSLLRERGVEFQQPFVPHRTSPGFFKSLRYLLARSQKASKRPLPWKFTGNDACESDTPVQVRYFSKKDTQKILDKSVEMDVSVHHLLLAAANRMVCSELLDQAALKEETGGRIPWLVPVNMRGNIQRPDGLSNHTSAVNVLLDSRVSAKEVKTQIREEIEKGIHWKTCISLT